LFFRAGYFPTPSPFLTFPNGKLLLIVIITTYLRKPVLR
jgi:hypothetical protein